MLRYGQQYKKVKIYGQEGSGNSLDRSRWHGHKPAGLVSRFTGSNPKNPTNDLPGKFTSTPATDMFYFTSPLGRGAKFPALWTSHFDKITHTPHRALRRLEW